MAAAGNRRRPSMKIKLVVGALACAVAFVSVLGGLVVVAIVASVLISLSDAVADGSSAPWPLGSAGVMLPAGHRERYLDEWIGELAVLPRWRRFSFTLS